MKKYSVAALCGFVEGLFLFKCRGIFFKNCDIKKTAFFLFYFAENKYRFRLRCGVCGRFINWRVPKRMEFFPDCAVGVKRKISQMLSENYVSDISGVLHYKSRAFKLLPD